MFALSIVAFAFLGLFFAAHPVFAGVSWGVSDNQMITGQGPLRAHVGDTVKFRFYWYDQDVAGGRDKVKLHVCGGGFLGDVGFFRIRLLRVLDKPWRGRFVACVGV